MKRCIIGLLVAVLLMGGTGTAVAADATAAVDVVSAYVWRGITFNDGMVVQPSIDVSNNGFGINVWGNLDVDDYDNTLDDGEFSEIDLTASYGFDMDPLDVSVGLIHYVFPNSESEGTTEVFVSAYTDLLAGITVGVDAYYDFDVVEDYYIDVFAGYAFELESGLSLGLGALAGYAGEDMSAGVDGGFHEYTFTADAGYSVTDALGLSAFIAYTDSFDEDVLPDQDVDVYGGASIAYSF